MGIRGGITVDGVYLGDSKTFTDTCIIIKDYLKKLTKTYSCKKIKNIKRHYRAAQFTLDKFELFEEHYKGTYTFSIELNLSKKEAKDIIDILLDSKKHYSEKDRLSKEAGEDSYYSAIGLLNLIDKTIASLRRAMRMKSKIPFGVEVA